MQKQREQKQVQPTLQQLHILKRSRIVHYPYYPITYSLYSGEMRYLFQVESSIEDSYISIQPFKNQTILQAFNICLQGIPRKLINMLHILNFKCKLKQPQRIIVENLEFILGFSHGYLVRAKFDGKKFQIIQKFNKKPNVKEGLMMRMSSMFLSSDQWYHRALEKPVFFFTQYHSKSLKYKISYQIGFRVYFGTTLSEQNESDCLRIYDEINWESQNIPSMMKYTKLKAICIRQKKIKAIITANSMLIEFEEQTPNSYIYTQKGLYVSNNTQNKIILYNIETMRRILVYRVDWQIKKMKLFIQNNIQILIIMPYDNYLYLINIKNSLAAKLKGHKSFITNSIITQKGMLISGGCDHRISLKSIDKIKNWKQIQYFQMKEDINKMSEHRKQIEIEAASTQYLQIVSEQILPEKFGQSYFFWQFDNNDRDNNFEYGFGSFVELGSQLYAFITYDFMVKIYRIRG